MSDKIIILSIISIICIVILTNLISFQLTTELNKILNNKQILIIIILSIIFISFIEINIALFILIAFILFYCLIKFRIFRNKPLTNDNIRSYSHKNTSKPNNIISFSNDNIKPFKEDNRPFNEDNIRPLKMADNISPFNEDDNISPFNKDANIIPIKEDNIRPFKMVDNINRFNEDDNIILFKEDNCIPEYNSIPEYNHDNTSSNYIAPDSNHNYKQIIDKQNIYENIKLIVLQIFKNYPDIDINIIIKTLKDIYPDNETIITNAVNEIYHSYNSYNSYDTEYQSVEDTDNFDINDIYDIKKLSNDYYNQNVNYKDYISKKSMKSVLTENDTYNPENYDTKTDIYNNIDNFDQDISILCSNNLKNNKQNICNNSFLLDGYDENDNFELQI